MVSMCRLLSGETVIVRKRGATSISLKLFCEKLFFFHFLCYPGYSPYINFEVIDIVLELPFYWNYPFMFFSSLKHFFSPLHGSIEFCFKSLNHNKFQT